MHVRFKQFMVIFEIELSKTINYTLEREREREERYAMAVALLHIVKYWIQ